ncbi:MAG: hypothetical protein ACW981_05955 [Candidatus Hodarchaeales archaeon]
MTEEMINGPISYVIQDDQGYSSLHYPENNQGPLSLNIIFESINQIVNKLREKNIDPISVEIYSGEIFQEKLIFQMIFQKTGNFNSSGS